MRVRRTALTVAAALTVLAGATLGQAAPLDGLPTAGKPMFQNDARHSGQSPHAGPRQPRLFATFDTREPGEARADIQSAIAVGPDGTVYFGNFRGRFVALRRSPGGAMQAAWSYSESGLGSSFATPAVDETGTVYLPLSSSGPTQPPAQPVGFLYSFGPDGKVKWKSDLGGRSTASPTIGPDGTIYQLVDSGSLVAITSAGQRKWAAKVGPSFVSSPALAPDGTSYTLSSDGKLYAVGPGGEVKWSADYQTQLGPTPLKVVTPAPGAPAGGGFVGGASGQGASSSPTIGSDGTIYFGANNSNFYAFGPDGKMKWLFEAERELAGIWSTAVLSQDGRTVFFGANAGGVYALDTATGKKKWQAPLYGTIYAATELDRDGRLYVATTSGHVIALEASSGRQLWDWSANGQPSATSIWTAPAILPDGHLVVADRNGLVFDLADAAAAPASAAQAAPAAGTLPRSGEPLALLLFGGVLLTGLGARLRRRRGGAGGAAGSAPAT